MGDSLGTRFHPSEGAEARHHLRAEMDVNRPKLRWSWEELPIVKQFEGASFQAVSGERGTVARFHLAKGIKTPPSKHMQEQFTYVIKGRLRYEVDEQQVLVEAGDMIYVGSNRIHRAEVLEDSIVLDFFSPAWTDIPNRPK